MLKRPCFEKNGARPFLTGIRFRLSGSSLDAASGDAFDEEPLEGDVDHGDGNKRQQRGRHNVAVFRAVLAHEGLDADLQGWRSDRCRGPCSRSMC